MVETPTKVRTSSYKVLYKHIVRTIRIGRVYGLNKQVRARRNRHRVRVRHREMKRSGHQRQSQL